MSKNGSRSSEEKALSAALDAATSAALDSGDWTAAAEATAKASDKNPEALGLLLKMGAIGLTEDESNRLAALLQRQALADRLKKLSLLPKDSKAYKRALLETADFVMAGLPATFP